MYKTVNGSWAIKIVVINVVIFLIQLNFSKMIVTGVAPFSGMEAMNYIFALIPSEVMSGKIWQLFTYSLLHGNFSHIFFNMYALVLFGIPLEKYWGSKKFIIYYIFTAIGAGLVILVMNGFVYGGINAYIPVIGASGAVFGLLLAFGMIFPELKMYIFFAIEIKAKNIVLIYGLIELMLELSSRGSSGISHVGHLGGLLFGYIFIKFSKNSRVEKRTGDFIKNIRKEIEKKMEPQKIVKVKEESNIEFLVKLYKKFENSKYEMNDDEWQRFKYVEIIFSDDTSQDENSEKALIEKINIELAK